MTPVIVLNMHYSGLGIARSLSPLDVPVYGLSSTRGFPGNYSRYCQFELSPDSLLDPIGLRDFLLRFADRFDTRPIVLPTRDHDIEFLLRQRDALEQKYIVPLAPTAIVETAMNKDACFEVAAGCGIALPATHTVHDSAGVEALQGQLTFPVIVKPLYARQWRRPGVWEKVGRQKAAMIASFDELRRFYADIEPVEPIATIQEYIPGGDSNLLVFGSYCRPGGEVRAYFTGRKLLQSPPLKGTGLVVEGRPMETIVAPSHALLKALRFSGISEIEFKVHDVTGVPYLIEINPRHWDQHYLGTACGVNLTLELYRDLVDPQRLDLPAGANPPPRQSATAIRWVAEHDLFFHLLHRAMRRDGSWRKAAACVRGRRTYSVMSWSDPRPGLRQLRNIAADLRRRFASRLRATGQGRTSLDAQAKE
jgi:predicted ATP-grasp superfamily ATP-dependent carboligase